MAIPKKDGHIRICSNYVVTINLVLNVNQHFHPKPEEPFATLAGGENLPNWIYHKRILKFYRMTIELGMLLLILTRVCLSRNGYHMVLLFPQLFSKKYVKGLSRNSKICCAIYNKTY